MKPCRDNENRVDICIPVPVRFKSLSRESNITFINTRIHEQGKTKFDVPVGNCIDVIPVYGKSIAMAARNNDR